MNTRNNHARLLLLLAGATVAACSGDNSSVNELVNTYTVSREDLPINVKEGGELVAVKETVVKSQVEGNAKILSLIPEGTLVKKGDKLVELDVSGLVDKQATQEIAVEKARNALEQARTSMEILEKELLTKKNTALSKHQIASMELHKLLGAKGGGGSEGKNADMVVRLRELVDPPAPKLEPGVAEASTPPAEGQGLIHQVNPRNYIGLVKRAVGLLTVDGDSDDPLQRDMGEIANKILGQADQIRLAMAQLKVSEKQLVGSRRLAKKQFITQQELERDELDFQSQRSKVTIAWNDLELLINYTLEAEKIEKGQNLSNSELEVERVEASNNAERKNSQFDITAKQKEFEVASKRLALLEKQIGNAVLYSPAAGLVVYSKVSRGRGDSEPVEEGTEVREQQSIIILPDNSKLRCKIQVQEAMIDKVKIGLAAHISAEVRPNETLTGRVTYVAPVADSASRWGGNDKKVYTTYVLLDGLNDDESLKAGMKASATITVETVPNVLTIPIQSVRRDRSVNYVWQKTDDGPVAVAVQVGANNQEKVELVSGLQEGDTIYRTPPGGQADPKFDQPALPTPEPVKAPTETPDGNAPPRQGGPGGPGGPGNGQRGGRGATKTFAEMTAEELDDYKSRLDRMEGMADRIPDEAVAQKYRDTLSKLRTALDDNDLETAQRHATALRAAMTSAFSGMRRGGERGSNQRSPRNGD